MLCTSLSILHGRKGPRFVHSQHYGVGCSVEVGLGLPGLYLWWGKPRLVTSRSRPGLVVVPNALAMARLSVVASLLAILPLPPSRFRPLAPYCPINWHLTAKKTPLQAGTLLLTPPPAGTLLLLTGWHPTAHRRWLASPLLGGPARPLPLRSFGPSSVTPSRGIALPLWLCPNAGERCNDLPDRTSWFLVGPQSMSFPVSTINYPLTRAPKGP